MAKQVKIRPQSKNRIVAGGQSEEGAGERYGAGEDKDADAQAAEALRDNRGVSRAALAEQARKPPEQIPSKRDFDGDRGHAAPAHLAHKPITRGTMHARVANEPYQSGGKKAADVEDEDV
jgi:hypothetical protein